MLLLVFFFGYKADRTVFILVIVVHMGLMLALILGREGKWLLPLIVLFLPHELIMSTESFFLDPFEHALSALGGKAQRMAGILWSRDVVGDAVRPIVEW